MSESRPVQFVEERVPLAGIEESVAELLELYGGTITASRTDACEMMLPLRRGVGSAGSVDCTVSWAGDPASGTVTMLCSRDVDAPKIQRVLLLAAGVVGALMFMLWPFYPGEKAYGSLAWMGGAIAFAVYLMTLKKSSGGIAADFLRRLADRQRVELEADSDDPSS